MKAPVGPPVHTLECGGRPMVRANEKDPQRSEPGWRPIGHVRLRHDNGLVLARSRTGTATVSLDGEPLRVTMAEYRPASC